ncbi:cysteine-rich KTR domain-containing protein [Bacillus sp. FJAT-44742]|uniref:cysteine-rich KTR domain-containing protein n=1 Tax=Bacillus sp. FJAT-44742 TaxID=2014005 RepID=UPI001E35DF4A|nr:cysteine-rich KTR domain-containing protein [Bacillus sp. FJAT-44742]
MDDIGKVIDRFDDYSPYEDIDMQKKSDGIKDDLVNHICPHLLFCPECKRETIIYIKEK